MPSLLVRGTGQGRGTDDIAHREHMRRGSLIALVDGNVAALVGNESDSLEIQASVLPVRRWPTAADPT